MQYFLLKAKINNLTTERQLLLKKKKKKKKLLHGIRKMSITDCGEPLPITAVKDLYARYNKTISIIIREEQR